MNESNAWWVSRSPALRALAVVCLLAAGGIVGCSDQGTPPEAEENRLSDQLDDLVEESIASDDLDPLDKIVQKDYGDDPQGQAELFVTSVFNEQVAMRNEYMAQLREIGWENILDPTRLKADEGLVETRQMLTRARDAAVRMCAQLRPRSEAHGRELITRLELSRAQKQEMLEGFLKGLDENAATTEEICRLEVAIVDGIADVVSVFERDPAWQPADGNYMFSEDSYIEEFNARLQKVQALTEAQASLQEQTMAKASGGLRDLGL